MRKYVHVLAGHGDALYYIEDGNFYPLEPGNQPASEGEEETPEPIYKYKGNKIVDPFDGVVQYFTYRSEDGNDYITDRNGVRVFRVSYGRYI